MQTKALGVPYLLQVEARQSSGFGVDVFRGDIISPGALPGSDATDVSAISTEVESL